MRRLLTILLALAPLACADPPLPRCADIALGTSNCQPTAADTKEARREFDSGLKFIDAGDTRAALKRFEVAAKLVPQNVEYITAREISRQRAVMDLLQSANDLMLGGKRIEALASYRAALDIDPQNEFAMQRLKAAVDNTSLPTIKQAKLVQESPEIRVKPDPGTRNFHFRGDTRELLIQVAKEYGIEATFEESVTSRRVRFDLDAGDYETAMAAAMRVTRTFAVALSSKQILLLANNPNNRREFDRMSLRTFYVPDAMAPQELNELVSTLRTLFEVRFITQSASASTITLRAPQKTLEAATRFMETLSLERPQVMLDIKAYEVSESTIRQLGVDLPNSFQMFHVPTEAQNLLGGQSIEDIVNQLISSGAINQAGSTSISALIAQFLSGAQTSPLQQPFATFGGGITLFGITFPGTTVRLNLNESKVSNLEHLTLRASQSNPAVMKIGTRYPVVNASFSPIFNTRAISQVIQNQSFAAPFPSFTYEDLGFNLKATPRIHRSGDVTMDLEVQIRALSGQALNGVPVISSREYKGAISVRDGQPAVLAGMVSQNEQRSVQGLPLLSKIPVAGYAVSAENKQNNDNELLIVITPRIIHSPERDASPQIPLPTAAAP
jgi:general secretion pathway protein D